MKYEQMKKKRLDDFKEKNLEMDKKEREQCRKTNQLIQELVDTCDNTPFNKALIKILGNMKGNINIMNILKK